MKVTGFQRNTDGSKIKKQLEEIEADMGVSAIDRFSLGAKSSAGILKFANLEVKDEFKTALREKRFDRSFE
eukprot:4336323-Karenia_brevis.AAC.1